MSEINNYFEQGKKFCMSTSSNNSTIPCVTASLKPSELDLMIITSSKARVHP